MSSNGLEDRWPGEEGRGTCQTSAILSTAMGFAAAGRASDDENPPSVESDAQGAGLRQNRIPAESADFERNQPPLGQGGALPIAGAVTGRPGSLHGE